MITFSLFVIYIFSNSLTTAIAESCYLVLRNQYNSVTPFSPLLKVQETSESVIFTDLSMKSPE